MTEIPEPWSTAAEKVGIRQTYRGIADAAGVSHVTVKRLIQEGRTSASTVGKVSRALRITDRTVYQWARINMSEWGPWNPPMEANQLNPRARAALDELIRAVVQGGSSDDRQSEAQKSPLEVAGRGEMTRAARTTDQPKGIRLVEQDQAGEENQDPGGWDEA